MPAFTANLNLYLPGGGSLGIGGADEVVDVDKLNQNFQKIDAEIGNLQGDTGWIDNTTGIFSLDPGWTLTTFRARKVGLTMAFYLFVRKAGTSITVPAAGDISNNLVGTFLPGWRPSGEQAIGAGGSGRTASGSVLVNGEMFLGAVGGTGNIGIGDPISLGGTILL